MRLGTAEDGDVVRNVSNGSFYRFGRLERGRARIRPLEHFPNGRLIPKPMDTLVDAGLTVQAVGPWHDGMAVEGPTRPRLRYESELTDLRGRLIELEAGYAELPVNGTGRLSRGSWMNKIKNARARIATVEAGLAPTEALAEAVVQDAAGPAIRARDVVLLPSGRLGLVMSTNGRGAVPSARVRVRNGTGAQASLFEIPGVPLAVLRPLLDAQLCTL